MNTKTLKIVDRAGNQLLEGDILRWFHFVGARSKKHYMYKKAGAINGVSTRIDHLDQGPEVDRYFTLHSQVEEAVIKDEEVMMITDALIVQRMKFHNDRKLDDLKRCKDFRD